MPKITDYPKVVDLPDGSTLIADSDVGTIGIIAQNLAKSLLDKMNSEDFIEKFKINLLNLKSSVSGTDLFLVQDNNGLKKVVGTALASSILELMDESDFTNKINMKASGVPAIGGLATTTTFLTQNTAGVISSVTASVLAAGILSLMNITNFTKKIDITKLTETSTLDVSNYIFVGGASGSRKLKLETLTSKLLTLLSDDDFMSRLSLIPLGEATSPAMSSLMLVQQSGGTKNKITVQNLINFINAKLTFEKITALTTLVAGDVFAFQHTTGYLNKITLEKLAKHIVSNYYSDIYTFTTKFDYNNDDYVFVRLGNTNRLIRISSLFEHMLYQCSSQNIPDNNLKHFNQNMNKYWYLNGNFIISSSYDNGHIGNINVYETVSVMDNIKGYYTQKNKDLIRPNSNYQGFSSISSDFIYSGEFSGIHLGEYITDTSTNIQYIIAYMGKLKDFGYPVNGFAYQGTNKDNNVIFVIPFRNQVFTNGYPSSMANYMLNTTSYNNVYDLFSKSVDGLGLIPKARSFFGDNLVTVKVCTQSSITTSTTAKVIETDYVYLKPEHFNIKKYYGNHSILKPNPLPLFRNYSVYELINDKIDNVGSNIGYYSDDFITSNRKIYVNALTGYLNGGCMHSMLVMDYIAHTIDLTTATHSYPPLIGFFIKGTALS